MHANVRRRENRLKMDKPSFTTEHATPDRRKPHGDDTRKELPPKLSRLRRKLGEKAKRYRSPRSLKPPENLSWYGFLYKRLGVVQL